MNIFIANLNFRIKAENLRQIFSEYGEVSQARIIKEKGTRRSKGYGFVEMDNEEEAKRAMEALDGAEWEGRNIIVKPANTLPRSASEAVAE